MQDQNTAPYRDMTKVYESIKTKLETTDDLEVIGAIGIVSNSIDESEDALTGFQVECIVATIITTHPKGEEFKKSWQI